MSLHQRLFKTHNIKINEGSYALFKPTTTAITSTQTLETNTQKEDIRQEDQNVYVESKLAQDQKAKGQEETESITKNF